MDGTRARFDLADREIEKLRSEVDRLTDENIKLNKQVRFWRACFKELNGEPQTT
jgi:cell division protein FtsB